MWVLIKWMFYNQQILCIWIWRLCINVWWCVTLAVDGFISEFHFWGTAQAKPLLLLWNIWFNVLRITLISDRFPIWPESTINYSIYLHEAMCTKTWSRFLWLSAIFYSQLARAWWFVQLAIASGICILLRFNRSLFSHQSNCLSYVSNPAVFKVSSFGGYDEYFSLCNEWSSPTRYDSHRVTLCFSAVFRQSSVQLLLSSSLFQEHLG